MLTHTLSTEIRVKKFAQTDTRAMDKADMESTNQRLKHLGFVRVAAIHALVCVSNLYDYAKQNSGPLRSTVETVAGAVNTVVGPVYEKFKGAPDHLLVFLDKRVDEASHKFDEHAPPAAKQVVARAQCLMNNAFEKVQNLLKEAQTNGPRGALHYAATEYKQFLVTNSVKLWATLDHHPSFHKVLQMAVPAAAKVSVKYNCLVKDMMQKGYPVVGYLPLVPVEEIANAAKQAEAKEIGEKPAHKSESSSDSD